MSTERETLARAIREAREAHKEADRRLAIKATVIAEWVCDYNEFPPSIALEEYAELRAEVDRLREAWFDASDAARAFTGRRKIAR